MSLIEEARRIAPELASAEAEGHALRRLPDRAWKHLMESGILRSLQPARFGGGERPLVEFLDAVVELSKASPSAGWVAGVIGVHPWQLALFADEAQQEMWADDRERMHSSSYNPTGKAERVPGGYTLQGRWSFSSGCDHCPAVILGAILRSSDAPVPELRSFVLYADQYRIEDNWHVAGLRGTGSKDIVVEETFVPEHRSQSHVDYALGRPLPGQETNPGPLYRLPWSVVFNAALAASVLGAAAGFIESWTSETKGRKIPPGAKLADDPLTQRRLAEAVWTLDAALARMRADAVELWQRAEARDAPTMPERGRYRWNLNRGCELVGRVVNDLMRAASGRSVFLDHPLQSRFQDVQAGLGHAFLVPDSPAKAVGGALLGAEKPELVL